MKRKSFLFYFFSFFLLTCCIASNVNAINYGIGVYENQELIWKCNVCNQIEMNDIFGSNWNDNGILKNLSQGKRMKWRINNINVNETTAQINLSIWDWTSESIWGAKDNDSEIIFFSNPRVTNSDLIESKRCVNWSFKSTISLLFVCEK